MDKKAKPISFNREMVVRILAGAKTQTRRIIKFKQYPTVEVVDMTEHFEPYKNSPKNWQRWSADHAAEFGGHYIEQNIKSPYGLIGQKLWVRESFTIDNESFKPYYWADDVPKPDYLNWHSGRFMPLDIARIFLEITGVEAERLQSIPVEDIFKEGLPRDAYLLPISKQSESETLKTTEARTDFKELWDSINKGRGLGWDVNPWVWVISFKVSKAPRKIWSENPNGR